MKKYLFIGLLLSATSLFGQSGQKWSTSGNSISSGEFLGTSNNMPLQFRVNNALAVQINTDGIIELRGYSHIGSGLLSFNMDGKVLPIIFPNDATQLLNGMGNWSSIVSIGGWQISGNDLVQVTTGNIGIGTTNPLYKLDVLGSVRISQNLYVGGGIVISEKVNATKEVLTEQLKSSSIKADSIIMDSTKAFYGYSKFEGDVKLKNQLEVVGNTILNGETTVNGNLRTSGKLIFANNKEISFQPTIGGFGNYSFALPPPPPPVDLCSFPATNNLMFNGMFYSWGNAGWNSQLPINVMQMGFDGSNGIIDVAGTNPDGIAPRLLINYYCGKDIFMNSGPHGGNIQLASTGKVGIGIQPDANSPKLDILGDVRISSLIPTSGVNLVQVGINGILTSVSTTSLGVGLWQQNGNDMNSINTANVGIGTTLAPYKKLTVNGDVSFANYNVSGNGNMGDGFSGFEILGNNQVPTRRGISLDPDPNGSVNFFINSNQHPSAFNFKNGYSSNITLMTIDGVSGNVGIGTPIPTKKLHVAGNACFGQVSEISTYPLAKVKIYGDGSATDNINWTAEHSIVLQGSTTTMSLGVDPTLKKAYISTTTTTPDAGTDLIINPQGGNVGIGTTTIPVDYKLAVDGNIVCKKVRVVSDINGADYVFEKEYDLKSIKDLENYIKKYKHLPDIPSADEMKKEGLDLTEMNILLLKKIEEISLYIIEQNKRIEILEKK